MLGSVVLNEDCKDFPSGQRQFGSVYLKRRF